MKRLYIVFVLLSTLMLGCKKEEYQTWEGDNYIYFTSIYAPDAIYDGFSASLRDTIVYNLGDYQLKDSLIRVTVQSKGFAAEENRDFDLRYQSEATEGQDYQVLNKDKFFISADSSMQVIHLKINRSETYLDQTYFIDLKLYDNDNFLTTLLPRKDRAGISPTNYKERVLQITDSLIKPTNWDAFVTIFGTYSSQKLRLFLQTETDLTFDDFFGTNGRIGLSRSFLTPYAQSFQQQLYQWQAEGHPVYEKDGNLMVMGDDVL